MSQPASREATNREALEVEIRAAYNSGSKPWYEVSVDCAMPYVNAIEAVLEKCAEMETDIMGQPSIYGKAFADTFRQIIADQLSK